MSGAACPVELVKAAAADLLECGPQQVLEFKDVLGRLASVVGALSDDARRRYCEHAFPLWSSVLLAFVAPQLMIFDKHEKKVLFDAFFLNGVVPVTCVVEALCSWLTRSNGKVELEPGHLLAALRVPPGENAGDVEAGFLLADMLGPEGLPVYFAGCASEGIPLPTVRCLLQCPAAVNNRLRLRAPPMFQRDSFEKHVAAGLVHAVASNFPIPAALASLHIELVSMSRSQSRLRPLTDAWVATLALWPATDPPPLSIMALVSDAALAPFLEAFICSLDKCASSRASPWPWFQQVLAPPLHAKAAARHALTERLLLSCALSGRTIEALAVIMITVRVGGATLLSLTLPRIGDAWSQTSFTERTDYSLQDSVTRVLVAGLAHLSREELEGGSGQLLLALVQGVSHRLHSSVPLVRQHGMRVATTFALKLGQPMEFDELQEDEAADKVPAPEAEHESSKPFAPSGIGPRAPKKMHVLDPDAQYGSSDSDDSEAEEPTDLGVGQPSPSQLAPFDLRDDLKDLGKVQRPVYLRACLDFLSSGDGVEYAAEKHELALLSVEELATRRPPDLAELCEPLTHAVLCLENLFNLEGFDKLKSAALMALCVASPHRVSRALIASFFDGGMPTGSKLETLDILVAAATALSGLASRPSSGGGKLLSGSQGKSTVVKSAVAKAVGADLAQGQTRRWGYRRGPAPRAFRNEFASIAADTFFPLSRGLLPGGSLSVLLHPDASLLVPQLLLALAALAECATNTPHISALALELLMCSWPLRQSSEAGVRRAVLVALSVALAHLNMDAMPGDAISTVQEIGEHVCRAIEADPDRGCRDAALALAQRSALLGAMGV